MANHFGNTLSRLRAERGLSQQELADQLHVTRSAVANWESGHRMPGAGMVFQIAQLLDTDVAMLLAIADEPPGTPNVVLVDDSPIALEGMLPELRFFRIPPLTLQPIVENAVKHGLDPDSEPLRIAITTRDTGPGVEIAVADTGPGFTPPDEGQGFALENIRGRLKAQCDGTLAIEAPEEGGTKATIFIPWKQPIES